MPTPLGYSPLVDNNDHSGEFRTPVNSIGQDHSVDWETPPVNENSKLVNYIESGFGASFSVDEEGNQVSYIGWFGALAVLVVLTVLDQVLVYVLYDLYGTTYAQFLNQGTAFVYGIVASVVVLYMKFAKARRQSMDESYDPSRELTVPWYFLVAIGLFNGAGNFCMGIGQPHVAGLTQSLLYLLGIPIVMLLSWLCLGKTSSKTMISGALLILGGAGVSGAHSFISGDEGNAAADYFWYSAVLFAGGQIFLAGEKVFEEAVFGKYRSLDVMVMFLWTIWTQFLLGWLLYPIQTVGVFGGLSMSDLPSVIWDGIRCTVGLTSEGHARPACDWVNPTIFFVYCTVDLCCYCWGLYVIQRGGANLMVIASAVALPIQQIAFVLPFMGKYQGKFFWSDGIALSLVMIGFSVCQFISPEAKQRRKEVERGTRTNTEAYSWSSDL